MNSIKVTPKFVTKDDATEADKQAYMRYVIRRDLQRAIDKIVSHPGDARARLRSISIELHVFDLSLYPEEGGVRACANKLRKLLTRLKPTARDLEVAGHINSDSPHLRMETTLSRIRNETAAKILSVVYELHLRIEECHA